MICEGCATAARGEEPERPHCRVCKREVAVYKGGDRSIVIHGFPNTRVRCQGSRKPPATGHDLCDGCSCQHKPRGSWQNRELLDS